MKRKSQDYFYFVATIFSGFVNYLYQILCSRILTLEDFGFFNSWLAEVSGVLFFAIFLQYLANLWPPQEKQKKIILGVIFLLICSFGLAYQGDLLDGSNVYFISVFIFGCVFSFLYGVTQGLLGYVAMGVGAMVVALTKFGYIYWWQSSNLVVYYQSLLISYAIGVLALAVYIYRTPLSSQPSKFSVGAAGALILSIATALIPQLDILVVKYTQTPETIGKFSYVSLFYRGFFFLMLIFLQWLFPRQIREASKARTTLPIKTICKMAGLGAAAGALCIFIFPLITSYFLNKRIEVEPYWILFSFIHIALLTLIFSLIQSECAQQRWKSIAGFVLLNIASLIVFSLLKLEITQYLIVACVMELIALLVYSKQTTSQVGA